MTYEDSLKVILVRMWEKGHSFEELRNMNFDDFGAVLGYWHEKGRIEAKRERIRNKKRK